MAPGYMSTHGPPKSHIVQMKSRDRFAATAVSICTASPQAKGQVNSINPEALNNSKHRDYMIVRAAWLPCFHSASWADMLSVAALAGLQQHAGCQPRAAIRGRKSHLGLALYACLPAGTTSKYSTHR